MKRSQCKTVPAGWQLPNSAEYDATVGQFAEAVRLADSGHFSAALQINEDVREKLIHLSQSSEFRHSGHMWDWLQKWRGLEGQSHRALGQLSADRNRESLGKKLEEDSQLSAVYKAPIGNSTPEYFPVRTCLTLFEQGVTTYCRAVIAWHNGAKREQVLEELGQAEQFFERLCQLCPNSNCYCNHLKACHAAIALIRDLQLSRHHRFASVRTQRPDEPGAISLLKAWANQKPASFERESAAASAEAPRAINGIKDLIFGGRKLVASCGPMMVVGLLMICLSQQSFIAGLLAALFGPVLMVVLAKTSWMWMSQKDFRGLLGVLSIVLGAGCGPGITHFPIPLAVISGIGWLLAMFASVYWLVCPNDVIDQSPALHRLVSHLARLQRQADDLSVECALWIRREMPTVISTLLTDGVDTDERPHLCFWLEWVTTSCVYAKEAPSVLLLCGQVIIEFTDFVIETLIPPWRNAPTFHQRDQSNLCTSWAVLLRCPLHLPRGDGIPDAC